MCEVGDGFYFLYEGLFVHIENLMQIIPAKLVRFANQSNYRNHRWVFPNME
jgi:hypothetical protein